MHSLDYGDGEKEGEKNEQKEKYFFLKLQDDLYNWLLLAVKIQTVTE